MMMIFLQSVLVDCTQVSILLSVVEVSAQPNVEQK